MTSTEPVERWAPNGRVRPLAAVPPLDCSPPTTVTVFVADGHEVIRLGLRLLLEATEDFELIGSTDSADEVIHAAADGRADVILVDPDLDAIGGRDLAPAISATGTRSKVCFLVDDPSSVNIALLSAHGANGFLHKGAAGRHLVEALRRLSTGELVVDPGMAVALMQRVLHPAPSSDLDELSARERELLGLLGEGRTNREIAASLYLSEKTVKNYLSRLFRKLGVRSRTEAALLSTRHHVSTAVAPPA